MRISTLLCSEHVRARRGVCLLCLFCVLSIQVCACVGACVLRPFKSNIFPMLMCLDTRLIAGMVEPLRSYMYCMFLCVCVSWRKRSSVLPLSGLSVSCSFSALTLQTTTSEGYIERKERKSEEGGRGGEMEMDIWCPRGLTKKIRA